MRRAPLLLVAVVALLVGQTSTSIDLTPVVSILMSILPVVLIVLIIGIVFKLIGGMFEGLSNVFKFAKLKLLLVALRTKLASIALAKIALAKLAILVAQTETNTTAIDVSSAINLANSLIVTILPVVLVIAIVASC
jgi:hypothetical protein